MSMHDDQVNESLRDGILALASLVLGIALTCLIFAKGLSILKDFRWKTAADDERERVTHIDQTDPATLTPHQGLPYVIADDDLCRIEITGIVPMVDEDEYYGYGHTLSWCGYMFELTIENKSQYLTIGAGIWDEPWVAAGEYSDGEHLENTLVTYHGFMNKIEPGEIRRGSFALFNQQNNFLYAVSALRGTFEICDEKNKTIATYPFSYVE